MSYLDNEIESLKRDIKHLEGDLHRAQRELTSLGALIAETVAWGKRSIGNPSIHDRNFETVMLYRALDYIERNANNAVRREGGFHISAEHVKGEATPTEDLAKWLGWDKETPTSIKLDADVTYPVEKVVELLESINVKLEHIAPPDKAGGTYTPEQRARLAKVAVDANNASGKYARDLPRDLAEFKGTSDEP